MLRHWSRIQSFNVYKFYSSGTFLDKYELADSLGDEAMLLDLGITVLANEVEGLHRNTIYFSDSHDTTTKDLFLELSARWVLTKLFAYMMISTCFFNFLLLANE